MEFGERTRDGSLGHAGDEGPHLPMTWETWGFSQAAAPVSGFSRGTTSSSGLWNGNIIAEKAEEKEEEE